MASSPRGSTHLGGKSWARYTQAKKQGPLPAPASSGPSYPGQALKVQQTPEKMERIKKPKTEQQPSPGYCGTPEDETEASWDPTGDFLSFRASQHTPSLYWARVLFVYSSRRFIFCPLHQENPVSSQLEGQRPEEAPEVSPNICPAFATDKNRQRPERTRPPLPRQIPPTPPRSTLTSSQLQAPFLKDIYLFLFFYL